MDALAGEWRPEVLEALYCGKPRNGKSTLVFLSSEGRIGEASHPMHFRNNRVQTHCEMQK